MADDYPTTFTLDFPADSGAGKRIREELPTSKSHATLTNNGLPDDDLNLRKDLERAIKGSLGLSLVDKSFLAENDDGEKFDPGLAVRLGEVRRVEVDPDRVKVTIQP